MRLAMKCGLKESHNTTQADDRSKRDGISAIWSQDMSLECSLQHVSVCDKYSSLLHHLHLKHWCWHWKRPPTSYVIPVKITPGLRTYSSYSNNHLRSKKLHFICAHVLLIRVLFKSIITLQYYISITVEGKTPHVHMCCAHNSTSRILALNIDEDVK